MPDADKEGPSGAEGPRTQVDRTGYGTVDIDNKGRYRTEAMDSDKGITTNLSRSGGEQTGGETNTTRRDNETSYTDNDEEDRQQQRTTGQLDNTP